MCRVSFSIPMIEWEKRFLCSWVSGIVFDTYEGRGRQGVDTRLFLPRAMGIVFDTYACVRALLLVVRVSFSIPMRVEEGKALIRGVFLSCVGYRFRYLCLREGAPSCSVGIENDTCGCVG